MNKHLRLVFILSVFAVVRNLPAQGTAFTYQGQLQNNGLPAGGTFALTFALFNTNAGGVAVAGPVTNNGVAVTNGLFTTSIDFGAGFFTGTNYWLEIGVTTNGLNTFATLAPRQPLTPAPYAVFASAAGNLNGALAGTNLSGTYGNALTLNNAGNSFAGNGANLTSLNANNLASGTVPLARLAGITGNQLDAATWQQATNLNGGKAALASNVVSGISITNAFITNSVFAGNGGGLTNLNPANLVGDLADSQLSANVPLLNTNQTFTGVNTFAGANQGLIVNGGPIGTNLFTGMGLQYNPGSGEAAIISSLNDNRSFLTFYTKQGPGVAPQQQMKIDRNGVVMIDDQANNNGVLNDGTTNGASLVFGGNSGEGIASQRTPGVNQFGLDFYTGRTKQMSILNNGNIGMGVTNPGTALQVNGTVKANAFSGDGSALTNLNASQLSSGTISSSQLPSNVLVNGEVGVTITGFIGGIISGNGNGLTSLNASSLDTGTVPNAVLSGFQGNYNTIGGGQSNSLASANHFATIGGGSGNSTSGDDATVGGGTQNYADSDSVVGGGYENNATAEGSAVTGGLQNYADSDYSFVGGGSHNESVGTNATIAGGDENGTYGNYSTVGGGEYNQIGQYNPPNADFSTISGGYDNFILGKYSCVPGGFNNQIVADYCFAAGNGAMANNAGSFVWSDNTGTSTASATANSVTFRASGGYRFFTGTGSGGAQLLAGATSWTTLSDRNQKKNFQPVDTTAVLDKLSAIPIQQWNYKWEKDTDVPNIGPMAQDFKHAFFPGRDDKGISTLEFDGVELAAIQGLNKKLDEKNTEIQQLEKRLGDLEKVVQSLSAAPNRDRLTGVSEIQSKTVPTRQSL